MCNIIQKWKAKDIANYIFSLENGKYLEYKSKLLKKLKEQGWNGELLKHVQRNDLLTIGITSFAHRIAIHNAILKVVNSQTKEGSRTEFI